MNELKLYKCDVGIDLPHIPDQIDDLFEIVLPISDNEIQAIIDGRVRIFWEKNPIDPWEYIETWAPKAYKKGNAIAEAYCVPKWGEDMKVENGAHYEFFLPEEIEDAIRNNEAFQHERSIWLRLQEDSNKQFHEDGKLLYNAYENGRFKNQLKGDPHWNNQIFSGIWSEGDEVADYAAQYRIHTLVEVDHQTIEVNYFKRYYRDYIQLEIGKDNSCEKIITKAKGGTEGVKLYMWYLDSLVANI
jgi:hypothetical protein